MIMSGSKDEGALLGGVKAQAQPPGRGFFVERRSGTKLVQVALLDDGSAPANGQHHAARSGKANHPPLGLPAGPGPTNRQT